MNSVSGYTGFSDQPDEQSGHYLALKYDTTPAADKVVVELIGGTKGPVTLDSDRIHVLLIKNKDTQSIKVTATKGELSTTETYTLTKLVLS